VKSSYTQGTGCCNPLVSCRLCLNQNFSQSGDTSDGLLPSSTEFQPACVGQAAGSPPQTRGLRRQQNALPQKINIGPAIHLTFKHLQSVNLAFDWAGAPGQRQPGFHRLIVVSQATRKPLKGLEATLARLLQPEIKTLRLVLTHEASKTLAPLHRFGQLGCCSCN